MAIPEAMLKRLGGAGKRGGKRKTMIAALQVVVGPAVTTTMIGVVRVAGTVAAAAITNPSATTAAAS